MKIINFEDAKAKIRSKEKNAKHLPDVEKVDDDDLELEEQYRELVRFYEHWYDEHVIGQDENGGWIYKNL